ncbi:hypothetical protein EDC94DRAFT_604361, partial [Helicostylum pulchrum]
RICGFFPQPKHESTDGFVMSRVYANYLQIMLQQNHLSKRSNRQQKRDVLLMVQETNYVQKISAVLEKLQVLPFRKIKFSSNLFFDQNDNTLVRNLQNKFGPDAVLIFWRLVCSQYNVS